VTISNWPSALSGWNISSSIPAASRLAEISSRQERCLGVRAVAVDQKCAFGVLVIREPVGDRSKKTTSVSKPTRNSMPCVDAARETAFRRALRGQSGRSAPPLYVMSHITEAC